MFTIQACCHPTMDTKFPMIMLQNQSSKKYLFGKVAEGTQRTLNEQKVRMIKLQDIYLTGLLDWPAIGGLPGLILTTSDQGKKFLNINYGNRVLDYICATWRYFIFRAGMDLNTNVMEQQDVVMKNSDFVVKCVNIFPEETTISQPFDDSIHLKLKQMVANMFPSDVPANNPNISVDPVKADSLIKLDLPRNIQRNNASSNYVIQFNQVRGKFIAKKAIELGVPRGILYSKLADGESVELENGTIVHPDQVLEPPKRFPRVLVLDIPNSSYLRTTFENESWFESIDPTSDNEFGAVFHYLNEDIDINTPEYSNFIQKFGPTCKHFISHPDYCKNSITFEGYTSVMMKLKSLNNEFFNNPSYSVSAPKTLALPNCYPLERSGKLNISSEGIQITEPEPTKSLEDIYEDSMTKVHVEVNHTKEEVLNEKKLPLYPDNPSRGNLKNEVQAITIGTGSALPSKYRNVSSNLIRLPYIDKVTGELKFRSMMLDGGENTLGSMARTYGEAGLEKVFKELKLIFLSHLHADHHLGIMSIIREWLKYNPDETQPLYIITPWQYEKFVNEWIAIDGISLNRIKYISCEDFLTSQKREPEYQTHKLEETDFNNLPSFHERFVEPKTEWIQDLYEELDISEIATCRAIHCFWAYSVSIKFDELDFKVSYSGDTRPNTKFIEIGRDSDLLIHEATLEDELIEEAFKKKHTTITEAIQVGKVMNSEKTILTHFSQRYSKAPSLDELNKGAEFLSHYLKDAPYFKNVFAFQTPRGAGQKVDKMTILYAFDCMIVKYGEIEKQEAQLSKINQFFEEVEEEAFEDNEEGEGDGNTKSKKKKKEEKKEEKRSLNREERLKREDEHRKKRKNLATKGMRMGARGDNGGRTKEVKV